MRLFNQLMKYEEPDRMVSVNYIKKRLKEMGYSTKRDMDDLHDLGPYIYLQKGGECAVMSALYRILDEVACHNCGRIVNSGERFCPNCGSKVRD